MKKLYFIIVALLFISTAIFAQIQKKIVETNNSKSALQKIESPSSIKQTNSSSAVTVYDFTTGSDQYYGGTSAAVEVETGVWAMIAGDTNGSGIITNSDKDPINTDLNLSGYYNSDANMSGIVTNSDKDHVNINLNKSTQVP